MWVAVREATLGAELIKRDYSGTLGAGRSRQNTPSRGKPVHMGKDGSGCEKEWML